MSAEILLPTGLPRPAPRLERWFRPMGLTLQLSTNSPAIGRAAQTSFGGFGPVQAKDKPDLTFRLFEQDLDGQEQPEPVFRLEGSLLYQTTGPASTLVADLARGLAYGYFSPRTVNRQAFFRWHFLEFAFFLMLESRGFMGVHGAALANNGRAILLRAASGGGKTTLAYAGARGSYQALAEDVVWLDRRRNRWWGLPWSFHLLPDARHLFAELAAFEPILQTNGEMKLEVNLETVRTGSTTVSAQPGPVVFVERLAGGHSRLEPVSPAGARRVWPAAQTGFEMKWPHHQAHVETLLSENNCYRLYFGDDIEAAVELLSPLFE